MLPYLAAAPLISQPTPSRLPFDAQLLTLNPRSAAGTKPTQELAQQLFNQLKELGYSDKDIVSLSSDLLGVLTQSIKQRESSHS